MNQEEQDLQVLLKERFASLPKVIQDAIMSADIEKHLRELADIHKLHLDQWTALENEVMLSLIGVQRMEDLEQHIKTDVGLDDAVAHALAEDVSRVVFTPVREALERSLEHPDAVAVTTTGVEDMRTQELAKANTQAASTSDIAQPATPTIPATPSSVAPTPVVVPGTPPMPAAVATVERAPISNSYIPATPSHERKTIEGDPYREQLQ